MFSLKNKKQLILIFLLLLPVPCLAYAKDSPYPKPEITLEGDKVIFKQEDMVYTFPSTEKIGGEGIMNVLREDFDADGEKEYIISVQMHTPDAVVFICKRANNNLEIQHRIDAGDRFKNIKPYDINKDGVNDLVIEGQSGERWSELKIVSRQNGRYFTLWDTGSPSGVSFETNKGNAQVRIGIPLTGEKENWTYNDEPNWEIWTWDGKKFVYSEGKTNVSKITKLRFPSMSR